MRLHKDLILSLLREHSGVLSEKYGVTRIGVFGSVARGEAAEGSDVDIVYEMRRPNLFTVVHLKDELEKILHASIDLVRYRDRMSPLLKQRIEDEAVYV